MPALFMATSSVSVTVGWHTAMPRAFSMPSCATASSVTALSVPWAAGWTTTARAVPKRFCSSRYCSTDASVTARSFGHFILKRGS